ncbi:hypothetical protein MLD38_017159 [Melastoma candidum]|uniref:Uncharacterized protein n=1 Tax=Melastoma candidum TaxID=119954 RepID=A0ACB9QPQ7_9MYRT|nr:hypothetical protein MLD38_017159 [Melastoma candidum]
MVGALSVVASSVVDSHASPCLCLDSARNGGGADHPRHHHHVVLSRSGIAAPRKGGFSRPRPHQPMELRSPFLDSWHDWRLEVRALGRGASVHRCVKKRREGGGLVVVNEVAGQYDDSFEDVKSQILNYFTYKAVRTVLNQLYEMNPQKYRWFYDFVVSNNPGDGKRFIRMLVKERQDLAERVMVTRLHLYGKWVKKCNHAEIYQEISDENLELMRERLMETVIWPTDDTSTEKIG